MRVILTAAHALALIGALNIGNPWDSLRNSVKLAGFNAMDSKTWRDAVRKYNTDVSKQEAQSELIFFETHKNILNELGHFKKRAEFLVKLKKLYVCSKTIKVIPNSDDDTNFHLVLLAESLKNTFKKIEQCNLLENQLKDIAKNDKDLLAAVKNVIPRQSIDLFFLAMEERSLFVDTEDWKNLKIDLAQTRHIEKIIKSLKKNYKGMYGHDQHIAKERQPESP
jgi:hypothetical protein